MALQNSLVIRTYINNRFINKVINLDDITPSKPIFTFNEHDIVAIIINSTYNISLYNTSLLNNEVDNELVNLKPQVLYKLTTQDEYPYLPGNYDIIINEKIYNFKVLSNKQDNTVDLNYLTNYLKKINEDYIYNYEGFQKNIKIDSSKAKYYERILDSYYKDIFKIINDKSIFSSNDIESDIIKSSYLGRQNSKTIRKNIISENRGFFYNLKKILSKSEQTKYYGNITALILKLINNEINIILDRVKSLEQDIYNLKKKNKYNHDFSLEQNNIINKENQIVEYLSLRANLLKYYTIFNKIPHNKLLKDNIDNNYKILENIYNELNKERSYTFVATPLIFEYYAFYLLDNIIRSLGFNADYINNLTNDFSYNYYKDNLKIELIYDKLIIEDYKCCNTFINLNSRHNRPDYILSLYIDNKLVETIIFDAKYRDLTYLINDKSLLNQALDYYQLAYATYDNIIKPISRVVFIGLGKNIIEEDKIISYLGFEVNEYIYKSKTYNKLYNIINELLIR